MNYFHAARYLQYLVFSGHRKGHGIHSPFVFDLVSRVFRNKKHAGVVSIIEMVRKRLKSDKRIIRVCDPGAGSAKNKRQERKVSEIAKTSSVPPKYGALLANLAGEFGRDGILELGTSFGISTMYMASACPQAVVYTIEACPSRSGIAAENFSSAGLENIRLLQGYFPEKIDEVQGIMPGFVFIDGDHRKERLIMNFKRVAEICSDTTVVAIDDIYNSREMAEAWDEIKKDDRVSCTVDIFRMGLVFFRKGMTRNNYIIRY